MESVIHNTKSACPATSRRVQLVREMFGVQRVADSPPHTELHRVLRSIRLRAGTLTFITGPSGSGKSTLLNLLKRRRRRSIDLAQIHLSDVPVVDCFSSDDLPAVLELLGRVGLGEVWTYLRTPAQLSDGQRWRLRLALALWRLHEARDRPLLVADEFTSLLDRLTARIVARTLRRMIDQTPALTAVVATSADDLRAALCPDLVLHCDFGRVEVLRNFPATFASNSRRFA